MKTSCRFRASARHYPSCYKFLVSLFALMLCTAPAAWPQEETTYKSSQTTITDAQGVTRQSASEDSTKTVTEQPSTRFTDSGLAGGASKSYDATSSRSAEMSNTDGKDLGGTELKNARTIASEQVGYHADGKVENDLGTATYKVDAGAQGEVKVGDNGVEVSGQAGLAAELEAVSKSFGVGNEDVGASAQVKAKVDVLAGAKGKIGAYIDEKGITIGAEGEAGVSLSASVELDLEAHIFGIQANVHIVAAGSIGVLAKGTAQVTIGFNGKVRFKVGAGVVIGIGAKFCLEWELDASELLKKLNLPDLDALIEWIEKFTSDPAGTIGDLLDRIGQAVIYNVSSGWVGRPFDDSESDDDSGDDQSENPGGDDGADSLPPVTPPPPPLPNRDPGGSNRDGATNTASGSGTDPYQRHSQYKTWSE